MKLLTHTLVVALVLLAAPAVAGDPNMPGEKTLRWLLTPPDVVPVTFAEQTKVVADQMAGAKQTTTAYGTDHLLTRTADIVNTGFSAVNNKKN